MSLSSAVLRKMLDKGLTLEDAIDIAEAWEEGAAEPVPVYDPREAKRAYDRDRMREKREAERVARQSHDSRGDTVDIPLETKVPPTPPSKTQTPSPPSPPKGGSSPKRPLRRCPAEWAPSDRTMAVLGEEGFSAGDLERALTRMRDHEFRTARSDWDATFRNWVRGDRDRSPRKADGERPHHDPKFDARQANLARAFAGSERAIGRDWKP